MLSKQGQKLVKLAYLFLVAKEVKGMNALMSFPYYLNNLKSDTYYNYFIYMLHYKLILLIFDSHLDFYACYISEFLTQV